MNDLEKYLTEKVAEASGTNLMPSSPPTYADKDRNPAKTIRKVADAGLHVDVTGKEAPPALTTKRANRYALPAFGRYPLDDYAQVKCASEYFDQYVEQFTPEHRREYCKNLVKRADELGIKVSSAARKYGADGYANDAQVSSALSLRQNVIKEAQFQKGLDYLAQHRSEMSPDDFAVALGEFDKVAGVSEYYGSAVPDPYWSTFGEKTAADDGAILAGGEYIQNEALRRFARIHSCKLKDTFGDDFAEEFRKDPVAITKSLPIDQKKMIIRLANSSLTDPTVT